MARTFVRTSSQFLEVNSTPITAVPLSMSIWGSSSLVNNFQGALTVDVGTTANEGWWIETLNDAPSPMRSVTHDGGFFFSGTVTRPVDGTWFFTAGRFSGNSSRFARVDQTESSEGTDTKTPSGVAAISIGCRKGQSGSENFWDGDLAEAALWNVSLLDKEFIALAKGYSPLFIRPQNLVFYCPIWGNDSPEIDIIGGRQMTLTGGTPAKADHPPIIYPSNLQLPSGISSAIYISPFPGFRAP